MISKVHTFLLVVLRMNMIAVPSGAFIESRLIYTKKGVNNAIHFNLERSNLVKTKSLEWKESSKLTQNQI